MIFFLSFRKQVTSFDFTLISSSQFGIELQIFRLNIKWAGGIFVAQWGAVRVSHKEVVTVLTPSFFPCTHAVRISFSSEDTNRSASALPWGHRGVILRCLILRCLK